MDAALPPPDTDQPVERKQPSARRSRRRAETPAAPAAVEPPAAAPEIVAETVATTDAPAAEQAPVAESAAGEPQPAPAPEPVSVSPAAVLPAARISPPSRPVGPRLIKPHVSSASPRFLDDALFKAAGIFVAVGAGWIIGANSFDSSSQTKELVDTMHAFSSKLSAVEQVAQRADAQDLSTLRTTVASLKSQLEAARSDAANRVAKVSERLDKLDRERSAHLERAGADDGKLGDLSQRIDKLERRAADITASIPVTTDAHALPLPRETTKVAVDRARIPADGYVLRRVADGTALVESRAGLREVVPGDQLPGAGRVRSIERRGRQWVVVTTSGVIDSDMY